LPALPVHGAGAQRQRPHPAAGNARFPEIRQISQDCRSLSLMPTFVLASAGVRLQPPVPEGGPMCLNCHVVSVDVQVKDLEAFARACAKLGWTIHNRSHRWYGRWMDDSPVPRGVFDTEAMYTQVCEMAKPERQKFMTALLGSSVGAVSVRGHDYEIGLLAYGDHYRLCWDAWHGELDLTPLLQQYAVETTRGEARRHGHAVIEQQ